MDGPAAKRSSTTAAKPLKEKVENLPLLCVEAICKFTPTAKLVSLYSKALPSPGAFWNFSLEASLKKRHPLSISDDLPCHQADDSVTLFHATGAKVASIKQPNAFRFSPLCELVERVSLTAYAVPARLINANFDRLQLYATHGDALVSRLPNVTALALAVYDSPGNGQFVSGDRLELSLKHLVPQLRSFEISALSYLDFSGRANVLLLMQAIFEYVREISVCQTSQLRRLVVPGEIYTYLMEALEHPALRSTMRRFLAGLNSLAIWHACTSINISFLSVVRPRELSFDSTNFRQLTQLQLTVYGSLRPYLTAFRATTGLRSLGLHLLDISLNGLLLDEGSTVRSVLDLRVICLPSSDAFAVASLFPNAKALAVQHPCITHGSLEVASVLCTGKLLLNVEKLSCFDFGTSFSCPNDLLTKFFANPHLPQGVDLSQAIFENLASDSRLLTTVYCALQNNTIKRLIFRGPLHRDALACLQSYADLNSETVKVTSWKDRDLGDQPGLPNLTQLSRQTDFKLVGTKLSGDLKGVEFTIRIVHSRNFSAFLIRWKEARWFG